MNLVNYRNLAGEDLVGIGRHRREEVLQKAVQGVDIAMQPQGQPQAAPMQEESKAKEKDQRGKGEGLPCLSGC